MTDGALKLVGTDAPKFDRLRWVWSLRDSGLIPCLTKVDARLLWLAYAMCDARGEADFPVPWLAEKLQVTHRAVRDALERLTSLLLIEHCGQSRKDGRIRRFRLREPERIFRADGSYVPRNRKLRSEKPEAGFRQRKMKGSEKGSGKGETAAAAKSIDGCAEASPNGGRLFSGPDYDARAKRMLQRWFGFSPRQANGLVGTYRPSRDDIRNLVLNVVSKAKTVDPVRSPQAFVRAALKDGNCQLDQRVLDRKDERKLATHRRNQRRLAEVDAQRRRDQDAVLERLQTEASKRLDVMPQAEQDALFDRIVVQQGLHPELAKNSRRRLLIFELIELMRQERTQP